MTGKNKKAVVFFTKYLVVPSLLIATGMFVIGPQINRTQAADSEFGFDSAVAPREESSQPGTSEGQRSSALEPVVEISVEQGRLREPAPRETRPERPAPEPQPERAAPEEEAAPEPPPIVAPPGEELDPASIGGGGLPVVEPEIPPVRDPGSTGNGNGSNGNGNGSGNGDTGNGNGDNGNGDAGVDA